MAQVVGEASGNKIPVLAKGHGTVPAIEAINDDQTDNAGPGLRARSRAAGVIGESKDWMGVFGSTESTQGGHGVMGRATGGGAGVAGESTNVGVVGKSDGGTGVRAESKGTAPALLVDNEGDGSSVLIFQRSSDGGARCITCIGPNGHHVFVVRNDGETTARGVSLTCDRNAKANLTNADTRQVLEKLAGIPIQAWNYKTDPTSVRHIGPTSQDFQAAFGLNGDDDIHISAVDAQGIALAAIQGLNEKLQAENAELRTDLASLEGRLAALESMAQRTAEPSPA